MSKTSEIRIPRTTAMFVTNLGQILREIFELNVTVHEQWTFESVANWEECLERGKCAVHGYSDEYQKLLDENPSDQALWMNCCQFPYEMEVYLGKAKLQASGKGVEVRTRIEVIQNAAMGNLYIARVWVKVEGQKVQKGHFYLEASGEPWINPDPMPDAPPDKIAFWHKDETKKPIYDFSSGRPRLIGPPKPITREKRIARQKLLAEASN
jgi:hypothetical protein